MHWAAGLSAIIAALGIIVVLRWMPGKEATSVAPVTPVAEPELAGTA
jgi:hypothetical protein